MNEQAQQAPLPQQQQQTQQHQQQPTQVQLQGQSPSKYQIKLSQNSNSFVIEISSQFFPSLFEYKKLNIGEKQIPHQVIIDMYFELLDKTLRITFGKKGLREINPYHVLNNIFNKIIYHYDKYNSLQNEPVKAIENYPQVGDFLLTPISYEFIFSFHSYQYKDNKLKEEQLRISNILGFDLYEEIRNGIDDHQGYMIQQASPEGGLDRYGIFQQQFKQNLFFGQVQLLQMEHIFDVIENNYVPLFVIQKMFFQLEDYFLPTYQLGISELRALQKITSSISVLPQNSTILFVPHNSLSRQRIDKNSAEKIESNSILQIKIESCTGCYQLRKQFEQKTKEFYMQIQEKVKEEVKQNRYNQTFKDQIDKLRHESINQIKKKMKNPPEPIKHSYHLKLSFGELFHFMHIDYQQVHQQISQQANYNNSQQGQYQYQTSTFKIFDVFSVVLSKLRDKKLNISYEHQFIIMPYKDQCDLEITLFSLLSLLFQLHFVFYYYYFYSQKLTQQRLVDFKIESTSLEKNQVVMKMFTSNFEIHMKVGSQLKDGLHIFNLKVQNPDTNLSTLQNWILQTLQMNPFLRQEVAYLYLQKGNKLITSLMKDKNKAGKIIALYTQLISCATSPQNFDLTVFEDEDNEMKQHVTKLYNQQNNSINGINNNSANMNNLSGINKQQQLGMLPEQNLQQEKKFGTFQKLFEVNYDIERRNQLIIYVDGTYAFFSFISNTSEKRIPQQITYNPNKNVFTDREDQVLMSLKDHFLYS